jgi:ABC-type uncharacterized transport system substrate-binding protein
MVGRHHAGKGLSLALLLCLILPLALGPAAQAQAEPPRVLVLHNYHAEYRWEQELNLGITTALAASGYTVEAGTLALDHFWMDTKRHSDPDYLANIVTSAHQRILETRPDVVIAADNNAIEMVVATWPDDTVPFVYAGLNNAPDEIDGLTGRPNVTGVLERVHVAETLEWVSTVFPEARLLAVLSDQSRTATVSARDVRTAIDASDRFLGAHMFSTNSFEHWQQIVTAVAPVYDVLVVGLYQTLHDENGVVLEGADVMAWTAANSTLPVVALWDMGVIEGGLGGSVISGETQGYEAGLMVARILQGESPHEIAVTTPRRGKLAINSAAVKRWNVQIPLDLIEVSTIYGPDGRAVSR